MAENNTATYSYGTSFTSLLTVLFIGLKLTGYITWSWLWVLSPLWIGFAFLLAVLVVGMLVVGTTALLSKALS